MDSMVGKTALITGASSGIGKATAQALAEKGAQVILLCRPGAKAEAALREIVSASHNDQVKLINADLSSLSSIRTAAAEFLKKHGRLDVLINNAGIYAAERQLTPDGYEKTFATNHLAYFLLTHLLLDMLKASAPARIVNVSSSVQSLGVIDFSDLHGKTKYNGFKAYSNSKLANTLFTYELARRLEGTNVTANCLHPGPVRSGFLNTAKGLFRLGVKLFEPFMLSPDKAAKTSIYLASSPEVEGVSGKYFIKCKPVRSARISYNKAVAGHLWEVSSSLCGLS